MGLNQVCCVYDMTVSLVVFCRLVPDSVSRYVSDSFACFLDYVPPIGLLYPASI